MYDEGQMEYIQTSLYDEMEQLEREVEKELHDVLSSCDTSLLRRVIQGAEEGSSQLKEQIHELRQEAETRRNSINDELKSLRKEMMEINNENQHLHEMMVFLSNQLNKQMSDTFRTSQNSSLLLDDIMNNLDTTERGHSRGDLLRSLKERVKFLENHCTDQSKTIQQLIEAKCSATYSPSSSSSFRLPANSTLTGEETIASSIDCTDPSARDSSFCGDFVNKFTWENHRDKPTDDVNVDKLQEEQQQNHPSHPKLLQQQPLPQQQQQQQQQPAQRSADPQLKVPGCRA